MNHFFVGIDIGGTFIRFLTIEQLKVNNQVQNYIQKLPLKKCGEAQQEIVFNICEVIETNMLKYKEQKLSGIGISLAAMVDRKSGIIKSWPNHSSWVGFNIKTFLENRYEVPVVIEDDANCGALGEFCFGSHKCKNLIYISLGTGIGCGIIIDEKIYLGENGFAGELGHTVFGNKHDLCSCNQYGCFQATISGRAILEKYNKVTSNNENKVGNIVNKGKKGKQLEKEFIEEFINYLAMGIYNVVMLFDISKVVIGGGLSLDIAEFIPQIESIVNKKLKYFNRKSFVTQSRWGENSGILGSLKLVETYKKEVVKVE